MEVHDVFLACHVLKAAEHYVIHYPDHEPRKASPLYVKTHHALCIAQDLGCLVCGARDSHGLDKNETHHFFVEYAAMGAIDWARFGEAAKAFGWCNPQSGLAITSLFDWSAVARDPDSFVDSVHNMIVLCPLHHRDPAKGIHHIQYPVWILQAYAKDGFEFVTRT